MYSLNCARVKWNNTLSDEFTLNNGVKQGGVISPLLFSLYLDPLLKHLKDSGKGCFMGNLCANAFAYADDIIILAPTCSSLKSLIKICEEYSNEYCLTFNPTKCSLIVFSDSNFDTSVIKIRLCNDQLKIVNSEKHLGHLLTNKQIMVNIDDVVKDMKIKTNIICNEFSNLPYTARTVIFNSQCLSLYGCPLWNLQDNKIESLCKTWRVCCRRILDIPNRTHNEFVPELMNTFPINNVIQERMLNFYMNGLNHSDSVVVRFFKTV